VADGFFECGCKIGAKFWDERCKKHALYSCHKDILPPSYPYVEAAGRCPPCFRAHIETVAVGPGISKLRYERMTGRKKVDMRGRENY
jgi:hypothetical protein